MGSHQISGPEPGGQRQLGVMHDGSGGDRGLATAAGALIGPGLGFQPPCFAATAAWADEPVRPACRGQILRAGGLITEALLELDQRTRKVTHRNHQERVMFVICSNTNWAPRLQHLVLPDAQG